MPSSSSFAPHRFVSSVPVSRSHQAQRVIYDDEEEPYDYEFEDEEETFDEEQPEIYQHRSQQLVHHVAAEQPKVVSNENNRVINRENYMLLNFLLFRMFGCIKLKHEGIVLKKKGIE